MMFHCFVKQTMILSKERSKNVNKLHADDDDVDKVNGVLILIKNCYFFLLPDDFYYKSMHVFWRMHNIFSFLFILYSSLYKTTRAK